MNRQYGAKSSTAVRRALLVAALAFVRAVRTQAGVLRVALVGSVATPKPYPKDIDLLVTISDVVDLAALARLGRRLAGQAQTLNSTADVFLASPSGVYLGRTCPWRACGPGRRVACGARYATAPAYLRDDLDTLTLAPALVAAPPAVLWPMVTASAPLPPDVEQVLLAPLRDDAACA